MKKVSIIVPAYNASNTIKKCLDSIINQTYKNIEIIVINDGSKDKTWDILCEYQKKDKRIRIYNQKNIGVSKTRNKGIELSLGYYIMFIDNDDFIDEDYVETYVKNIKDNDVLIGGYKRTDEEDKVIKELSLIGTNWCKLMVLAPWAKLYKKDYLIKNDIKFLSVNIGEDVYFNLQAMLLSKNVKAIDNIGYNWFFNTKSVSNTIQKNFKNLEVFKLLDNCYEVIKEKGILDNNYDLVEMHFIRYIFWFLSYSSKKMKYKDISEEYDKLFNWLNTRFPEYRKSKYIGIFKPKGEIFSNRVLFFVFMIFHKLKLGKLIVYLYGRI